MKSLVTMVLIAGMILPQASNSSTTSRPEYELHAMMVYNFIKHIKWPNETEQFVIGVIGDDKVFNTLDSWYGNRIRMGKKLKVVKFSGVLDQSGCNILYLGSDAIRFFEPIRNKIADEPTLLITAKPGLGTKGSSINFRNDSYRLRFELNQKALDRANLKVSGQLSALAILV